MTDFKIVPAERQAIIPLIGIYAKSNGGKTHSALLIARGIVGPAGRIVLIDTENKRGHVYSDIIPGGYKVIDFDAPFSPERYIEAIDEATKNADIIVIDSMTHEWKGEGGILESQEVELFRMAKNDFKKQEQCKMAAWIRPKMRHQKLIQRILRIKVPVICCLRGYEKTIISKKDNKTVVETDANCTPVFDKDFISEMLMRFELAENDKGEGGYVKKGKVRHPGLKGSIPGTKEQFGVKHGEFIASWCNAPLKKEPLSTEPLAVPLDNVPAATSGDLPAGIADPDPVVNFKVEIWKLLTPIWKKAIGPSEELDVVTDWLREKAILADDMSLADAIKDEELAADMYTQIPIALSGEG